MPKITRNNLDTSILYSAEELERFKSDHGQSAIPAGSIEFLFSNATGEHMETIGAMIETGEEWNGEPEHGGEKVVQRQQYSGDDLNAFIGDAKFAAGL